MYNEPKIIGSRTASCKQAFACNEQESYASAVHRTPRTAVTVSKSKWLDAKVCHLVKVSIWRNPYLHTIIALTYALNFYLLTYLLIEYSVTYLRLSHSSRIRFYVFFKIQKNATFYVFWSVVSKKLKNVESVVQAFTVLHFEIANWLTLSL